MEDSQTATTAKRPNPKNFRISKDGETYLLALTAKLGLKQVGVLELAIRRLASAEGVTLENASSLLSTGAPSVATGSGSPVAATSGE